VGRIVHNLEVCDWWSSGPTETC